MTDLLYDYLTTGIDLIISAVILANIVLLLYSGTALSTTYAKQQENYERVNTYKEFNQFDKNNSEATADLIMGSDVVSALIRFNGECPITVIREGYSTINMDATGKITRGSSVLSPNQTTLSNYINAKWQYKVRLISGYKYPYVDYDGSQPISGIIFTYVGSL